MRESVARSESRGWRGESYGRREEEGRRNERSIFNFVGLREGACEEDPVRELRGGVGKGA